MAGLVEEPDTMPARSRLPRDLSVGLQGVNGWIVFAVLPIGSDSGSSSGTPGGVAFFAWRSGAHPANRAAGKAFSRQPHSFPLIGLEIAERPNG